MQCWLRAHISCILWDCPEDCEGCEGYSHGCLTMQCLDVSMLAGRRRRR